MFLCQPLLDVLIGRGIVDVDSVLRTPSWNDLPDPMSIAQMRNAAVRVLHAVKEHERIVIHGDYDCDGVLGTHILRSVLCSIGLGCRNSAEPGTVDCENCSGLVAQILRSPIPTTSGLG